MEYIFAVWTPELTHCAPPVNSVVILATSVSSICSLQIWNLVVSKLTWLLVDVEVLLAEGHRVHRDINVPERAQHLLHLQHGIRITMNHGDPIRAL